MSEAQLSAFISALKADVGLQERLKSAKDLDGAVTIAKECGFAINKDALLKYQAQFTTELSDDEVAGVAGGLHVQGANWEQVSFYESILNASPPVSPLG